MQLDLISFKNTLSPSLFPFIFCLASSVPTSLSSHPMCHYHSHHPLFSSNTYFLGKQIHSTSNIIWLSAEQRHKRGMPTLPSEVGTFFPATHSTHFKSLFHSSGNPLPSSRAESLQTYLACCYNSHQYLRSSSNRNNIQLRFLFATAISLLLLSAFHSNNVHMLFWPKCSPSFSHHHIIIIH